MVRQHYGEREQQGTDSWTGGHLTEPKEQKTQQSPGFGRSTVWQAVHSWKYTQASVGMSCSLRAPQCGHVSVERRTGSCIIVQRAAVGLRR